LIASHGTKFQIVFFSSRRCWIINGFFALNLEEADMNIGSAFVLIVLIFVVAFVGLGALSSEYNRLKTENDELKNKLATMSEKLADTTTKLEKAKQDNQTLTDEQARIANELEQAQQDGQHSRDQIEKLTQDLKVVTDAFNQSQDLVETLTGKQVEAIDELTKVKNAAANQALTCSPVNEKTDQAEQAPFNGFVVTSLLFIMFAGAAVSQKLIIRWRNHNLNSNLVTIQMTRQQLGSYITYMRKSGQMINRSN
jgi:hypothetical protein